MIEFFVLRQGFAAEWDEIMRLAEQIPNGQILIKMHEWRITISEYRIRRKSVDAKDGFGAISIV